MKILEKKERALGTRLFVKGERCASPKCAMVKKPYRPGQHNRRFRQVSEYSRQLMEKQKVRFSYGLKEKEMKKYFIQADKSIEPTYVALIKILESRLDNVVFRLGWALSRRIARQLISHGHILINDRKVTISSIAIKTGDKISFRPESKDHPLIKDLPEKLKNYEEPDWLKLDKEKMVGEIIVEPQSLDASFNFNLVVNYYSK